MAVVTVCTPGSAPTRSTSCSTSCSPRATVAESDREQRDLREPQVVELEARFEPFQVVERADQQ